MCLYREQELGSRLRESSPIGQCTLLYALPICMYIHTVLILYLCTCTLYIPPSGIVSADRRSDIGIYNIYTVHVAIIYMYVHSLMSHSGACTVMQVCLHVYTIVIILSLSLFSFSLSLSPPLPLTACPEVYASLNVPVVDAKLQGRVLVFPQSQSRAGHLLCHSALHSALIPAAGIYIH